MLSQSRQLFKYQVPFRKYKSIGSTVIVLCVVKMRTIEIAVEMFSCQLQVGHRLSTIERNLITVVILLLSPILDRVLFLH